jgi:hypothetical protein
MNYGYRNLVIDDLNLNEYLKINPKHIQIRTDLFKIEELVAILNQFDPTIVSLKI